MKARLSSKELKELERLAGLHVDFKSIAFLLGVDWLWLNNRVYRSGETDEKNAFMKGTVKSELVIKEQIFKDALDGNTDAQKLALELINKRD